MKKLLILLLISSCSATMVKRPELDVRYVENYKLNGHGGTVTNNFIEVIIPDDMAKNSLVATFQTSYASLYINGVKQVSGITANNFESRVKYDAIGYDKSTYSFFVEAKHNAELIVNEYSNLIKITGIDCGGVYISYLNSPAQALMGKFKDDITYCYKESDEANYLLAQNNSLKRATDFNCTEFVPYAELPQYVQFGENQKFINIIAKYDSKYYLYNRLYIDDNYEFFSGTCQGLFDSLENFKSYVLTENLNCQAVFSDAKNIDAVSINGNGFEISKLKNIFEEVNFSYIANINFKDIKNISETMSYSLVENVKITNSHLMKAGSAGYIAGVLFDTSINNLYIESDIYSTGDENGLITGKLINNFVDSEIMNIDLRGYVEGLNLTGGAFGMIIDHTNLENFDMGSWINGTGAYVGCLSGHSITEPDKINVRTVCEFGELPIK